MKREGRRLLFILLLTVLMKEVICGKTSWWFNTHVSEIKQKCDKAGSSLFNNLVSSVERFKDICKMKYAKIEEEFWKVYSNITLKFMLYEYCYNDRDVRDAIVNMTNSVQLCLEREERIKKNIKTQVKRKMFDTVCSVMELYVFYNARTECEEILRKESSFNNCYEKYPNVWPAHSLWPLPFIQPDQVCEERKGLRECQWEVVKDCIPFTWYTHVTFKSLLTKAWSSIYCTNDLN